MTTRRTSFIRTTFMAAACLALAVVFLGCGDPYVSPSLASTEPPLIRVRLGSPRTSAKLLIAGQGWRAQGITGQSFGSSGTSGLRTELGVGRRGIVFQGRDTGCTMLRVKPTRAFGLDDVTYAGTLQVKLSGGKLELVNELDLETYVAGVIGNEVGPRGAPSTYRAQAVAARTYAWMKITQPDAPRRTFHLYDSASSQVYRGMTPHYGVPYADMLKHTRATNGVILTFKARPFRAYYSSTCGGHTTDHKTSRLAPGHASDVLQGVPCRWCKTSKYFSWPREVVTEARIISGLKRAKKPVVAPVHAVRVTERGRGNWVRAAEVIYGPSKKARSVTGPELRTILGVRSHNIQTITKIAGGFRISGRGWGHGVGMCQVGAIEMGKAGASESDILRSYYPGIALRKVY